MTSAPSDPADAIAAALARLRGRRMPRPPWDGSHGPGAHHGDPGDHRRDGGWMRGGPHAMHGTHGGMGGPAPWGGGPRIGGPARLRLLEALSAAAGPLSVNELADAVGVDQPRASRLVQQAAQMGLVRREADPDDARRTRVALTDQGLAIVRGFRGERRNAVDSALSSFSEQERTELARLLTKLADSWPK
ncbi:MarR family winged helix-turn-helix transcriptional regulator [Microbacterium sp. zg.B48]|uniref:MarR family winged helix-turn-helix transcriptional regulator n=1 Tax=Microbacterium sp. zg.B48 TaxID=2969408 RepID=UPI00214BDBFB|nr:MarR family winged helix-turn-helix transcriptional regulator [Microbacterium sp. zg.B48]MCR2762836.1 MarR family winged helix-turn-helix transcriptional regulator [Microbacterium sp. zg.B48]